MNISHARARVSPEIYHSNATSGAHTLCNNKHNLLLRYNTSHLMFPRRFIGARAMGDGISWETSGAERRRRRKRRRRRRESARRRRVAREDERLSEEDRAKGIILIAPDFLSSPLCDPGARFLVHPRPLPSLTTRPGLTASSFAPVPAALSHFCD